MLGNFILTDNVSLFVLIIFVLMITVGIGVFIFLFRQLTKKKDEMVEEIPHSFDGIHEKNSATPVGMHLVMLTTVVFSAWYVFIGFPLFDFDQKNQYNNEVANHKALFDEKWRSISGESKLAMGESVFNTQCVICHGINAQGGQGRAANLIEFGNEEHIIYVLKNGSKGLRKLTPLMPPQYELLGEDEPTRAATATNVAAYVITLSGRTPSVTADLEAGRQTFEAVCSACHGLNGQGNGPNGDIPNFAANLTEYGSSNYIKEILKNGKKGYIGVMPAFEESGLLSEVQYDALSDYVSTKLN